MDVPLDCEAVEPIELARDRGDELLSDRSESISLTCFSVDGLACSLTIVRNNASLLICIVICCCLFVGCEERIEIKSFFIFMMELSFICHTFQECHPLDMIKFKIWTCPKLM